MPPTWFPGFPDDWPYSADAGDRTAEGNERHGEGAHAHRDATESRLAADITYIPMARGFVCLVVIMDWASRKVLRWRLSPTLTSDWCVAALEEALARYGCPEIFNTDQGSQFTSLEFLNVLRRRQIAISMDGKGCWRDNVFVERLCRSVKYEEVYLRGYETCPMCGPASPAISSSSINVARTAGSALESQIVFSLPHCPNC